MKTEEIEIAPFDNLLVYKKGYTTEFVERIINEKKLGGLRIFAVLKSEELDSISFLKKLTFLRKLDITASNDFSFDSLGDLSNLKKLSINVPGETKIDFSNLTQLEYLSINWRKNLVGLEKTNLLSLCIVDFTEKNLSALTKIQGIKSLKIKTGTIKSLSGIEELKDIEEVNIGNCKQLISIQGIDSLIKLSFVEFNKCKNIVSFESLRGLPRLITLNIIDCGEIDSIVFVTELPSLRNFSLLGNTIVKDGNLFPAKSLYSVQLKHYKHYNIKIENKEYGERVNNNLSKIKKLFG